jgi:hypothetical protein
MFSFIKCKMKIKKKRTTNKVKLNAAIKIKKMLYTLIFSLICISSKFALNSSRNKISHLIYIYIYLKAYFSSLVTDLFDFDLFAIFAQLYTLIKNCFFY